MPSGTPINRHYVVILEDGRVVVDWGSTQYQDICTGEFFPAQEDQISYPAPPEVLETLRHTGCIESYDDFHVFLRPLPEKGQRTID